MVAPAASVAIISEFNEVYGTVVFARPLALDDSVLMRVDLDKCPGPDQRIQRVVLGSYIPIENITCSGLLRKEKRHFAQALEHPVNEARPLQQNLVRQFHGRRDDRRSRNSACA